MHDFQDMSLTPYLCLAELKRHVCFHSLLSPHSNILYAGAYWKELGSFCSFWQREQCNFILEGPFALQIS